MSSTEPTHTTRGNNEWAAQDWLDATGRGFNLNGFASASPDREYTYPWTDQWHTSKCSPAAFDSAQRNDIDAADANLQAMHNRMHDFAYNLGFTETAWNLQDDNFGKGGLGTTFATALAVRFVETALRRGGPSFSSATCAFFNSDGEASDLVG